MLTFIESLASQALVEATSHLIGKEHAIAQAAKQRAAAVAG